MGVDTKVLDCGCGYGQWSLALAKHNKLVYGIDIQEKRIQIAQRIGKELLVDNVLFQVASAEDLPFRDNIFDFVFCYSVIYMIDWKRALPIRRWLCQWAEFPGRTTSSLQPIPTTPTIDRWTAIRMWWNGGSSTS